MITPQNRHFENKKRAGVCVNQLFFTLFIYLKSPLIACVRRVYASISRGVKIDQLTWNTLLYFCFLVDNTPHPLPFIYLEFLVFMLIIIIFLPTCDTRIPLYYGIVSAFSQVPVYW